MSQANFESGENPGDETCRSGHTSPSSSSTSSSTTTTPCSDTSKSCSCRANEEANSGVSDNDGGNEQKHCFCQTFEGHLKSSAGLGLGYTLNTQLHETTIDRHQPTEQHELNSPETNCQVATMLTVSDRCPGNEQQQAAHHSRDAPTSQPVLQSATQVETFSQLTVKTHDTQRDSASRPDNSVSVRLTETDKQNTKHDRHIRYNLSIQTTSLGSSYSNLSSATSNLEPTSNSEIQPRRTLRPAPSPSPSLSTIDTNNNNGGSSSSRDAFLNLKRTNFSKSASGSRLNNRNRSSVCDCLTHDCGEKKHSNRRQFIEHYYNSRTQLPTSNTSTSSFNISTPLNRLSECDAITRRLLSSPIRTTNINDSLTRRTQVAELDKSRRASLGTNSITDQVFSFTSNPFKSLELGYGKNRSATCNDNQSNSSTKVVPLSSDSDAKLNQQQARSLSVCDEETLNPRSWSVNTNHSPSLNRAVSLAYDAGSSPTMRRWLTIIPLFGCDIKSLDQFAKFGLILPPVIDSAIEHILVNGIEAIGIFRKSGVRSRILNLKQRIETNQETKFDQLNQNNEFSIYDIADLVKMWFRELKPAPLMTKELIKSISAFMNATSNQNRPNYASPGVSSQKDVTIGRVGSKLAEKIDPDLRKKIDSITTSTHRCLLLRALNFLSQISSKCETNQMTSQNLAICLTPSLCATESDQSSIILAQKALEYCINNHKALFGHM